MTRSKIRTSGADGLTLSSTSLTVANGLTLTDGDVTFADGHGLNFAATGDGSGTDSSELFDDYEEGTWTPVAAGDSSSGSASYSIQSGDYVKIGKMVYIRGRVGYSSGTGSGDLIINGLPYSSPSAKYAFLGLNFRDGLTISSGKTAYAFVMPSTATVQIIEIGTGTSATDGVAYDSAVTDMSFSGFYLIA